MTQGAYGDAGNLELLVPGTDGGMWVFWWNADPVDHQQGAARGGWSGGLQVLADRPVRSARITQMRHGPNFLEALALVDDRVLRLHWTPADGFVTDGEPLDSLGPVCSVSRIVESADTIHVLAISAGGELTLLSADADGYPDLPWRAAPLGVSADRADLADLRAAGDGTLEATVVALGRLTVLRERDGWEAIELAGRWRSAVLPALGPTAGRLAPGLRQLVVGVAEDGQVVAADLAEPARSPTVLWPAAGVAALAAALTDLDGGRVDVVARAGSELWHGHFRDDGDGWPVETLAPVTSTLWTDDAERPIHRHS